MQRFWNKVNRDGPNGCWEWTASCFHGGRGGYGGFLLDGKWRRAHRVSWMFEHGPIPAGLHVLHRCDNRRCVNPDHLWLGTHADNMRDKAEKGRAQPGDSHPLAKLTEAAVLAIRSDKRTQTAIAADYGVDSSTISLIKNRKRWAHI